MKTIARLKAKKAFTLVELVTVIAIIGILAAILIPTMVGVAQSARVSSANLSANDVRKFVNMWITKLDTTGHYINKSKNVENDPYIIIDASDGEYVSTFSDGFWANEEDEAEMVKSLSDFLILNLGYRELYAVGYLNEGAVEALVYFVNSSEVTEEYPGFADFTRTDYWPANNGIAENGTVIGTSPQIVNG